MTTPKTVLYAVTFKHWLEDDREKGPEALICPVVDHVFGNLSRGGAWDAGRLVDWQIDTDRLGDLQRLVRLLARIFKIEILDERVIP